MSAETLTAERTSTEPVVKLQGITKGFPDRKKGFQRIVGTTDVDIDEGEFITIIGPSGCGKSTILKMIAGLESVDEGSISLAGEPITAPSRELGIVFQQHVLLPWMSARQNVIFALETDPRQKRSKQELESLADEYLELVNLSHAADRRPTQLSGGMQQRVGIARAFALEPKVMLLDEPLGALDALTRHELQLQLLELCEQHKRTFIMVTHDVDEALLLSDRILVMGAGPEARIVHDITVPFSRPRDVENLEQDPKHHELRSFLLSSLTGH
ncbi:ABC transporter ATP-binding protein [Nesterenkonia jeotgali]|uniref:Nitrate/nitrite transport system ATP-binding protein n=1 Tax=Nesterenkonia jeotgali TaxID=317018 RepID=A0A839FJD6_9MICC|nr:ABC transporter ATP-binding protein [Nesterenkonia jeotgali]MBA8921820.1 nitrate/nitrite transport system ATP-binding protein [Nesterenkonia jeotgali]